MFCSVCDKTYTKAYYKTHLQTVAHNKKCGKHRCTSCKGFIPNEQNRCASCVRIEYSRNNPCKHCLRGYLDGRVHTQLYDNLGEFSGAYCSNCVILVKKQAECLQKKLVALATNQDVSNDSMHQQHLRQISMLQVEMDTLKDHIKTLRRENTQIRDDLERHANDIRDYVNDELSYVP